MVKCNGTSHERSFAGAVRVRACAPKTRTILTGRAEQIVGRERSQIGCRSQDWNAYLVDCRRVNSTVRRPHMNSHVSSEWIVNATHEYIAERAQTHPEIAAFVDTLNALPLYVDWGGGV